MKEGLLVIRDGHYFVAGESKPNVDNVAPVPRVADPMAVLDELANS